MKNLSLTLVCFVVLSNPLLALTLHSNIQDKSLIIYNSNIGLVHESRNIQLKKDDTTIIYEEVASSINTDSVNVSLPSGITLYSQQYRFDKLTQNKIRNEHIGKKVSAKIMKDASTFEIISATLLSNDGDSCLLEYKNKIIIAKSENIIFNGIPKELITKPSLVWNVKAKNNIDARMSIDYLMHHISYKSNYILTLHGDNADLSGWITIDNRSGKAFKNTLLHVLAGDINTLKQPRQNYTLMKSMPKMEENSPAVTHQAYEGYHFYTIPFKVNLANNEKTQIKFISQDNISVQRKYKVQVSNPNYFSGEVKHEVYQHVAIKGFTFAAPKGILRSYSKLGSTNILLGESLIPHTPKDMPLSLTLGKIFDIKVKETLIKRDRSTWYHDNSVQYSIKNSSNENKTIEMLVPFSNNSSDEVKSKEKYTLIQGNILAFHILVKANTTKKFNVYYKNKVQH